MEEVRPRFLERVSCFSFLDDSYAMASSLIRRSSSSSERVAQSSNSRSCGGSFPTPLRRWVELRSYDAHTYNIPVFYWRFELLESVSQFSGSIQQALSFRAFSAHWFHGQESVEVMVGRDPGSIVAIAQYNAMRRQPDPWQLGICESASLALPRHSASNDAFHVPE